MRKNRNYQKSSFLLTLLLVASNLVFGQSYQLETEKGIASSIAPYSLEVRQAILQASQYPQVLTQLSQNQQKTKNDFQNLISGFRQTKQSWFYTLTRYPELMHSLAILPKGQSKDDIQSLLPNQDPELVTAAWKIYKHEKEDLVQADNINQTAQKDFNNLIQNVDEITKASFLKLASLPDVMTFLTNNIELTSKLGNRYKENASQVNGQLAALHDSLNVQNQIEIAAYKKQLEENPQAKQELSQAARDYAKANGYNIPNQQYANNQNYYANPYSYWFGYPSWYGSPLWYPGSYWSSFGIYGGMGIGMGYGMYGFPSYGFYNWFFNGGYYVNYPILYRQFGNYYRSNIGGHRYMGSANRGFMDVAQNHFSGINNRQNSLAAFSENYRSNGQSYRTSALSSRTYSNSGSYGGGRSFGGGGFRSGGGGGGGRHR